MKREFSKDHKTLIGMIHLLPLPGTFKSTNDIQTVIDRAVEDAVALEESGFDAVMVENEDLCVASTMSDVQKAGFSIVVHEVRKAIGIPIGIAAGCLNYKIGLSLALVAGCDFIRTSIFVDTVMNYNGIISPCAADIINYRKMIGAEDVLIFADVHVKHYHMLCDDIGIAESASWAERQGADAVIVTGSGTGVAVVLDELEAVSQKVHIPVAIGSGLTLDNILMQIPYADICIVGTSIRIDGSMKNGINRENAKAIVNKVRGYK